MGCGGLRGIEVFVGICVCYGVWYLWMFHYYLIDYW